MNIVNVLAEDKKLVTYRPRLNEITGSVTATVLLQQIIFHSDNVGYRSFYKFRAPCSHKLYREGDSWTEELGFSPAEFDTARSKIATRVMKGDSKTKAMRGETANHLVIYWTDASRVTWYSLNVELLNRMLEKLYADSRNSNYQKNAETPNSVIQETENTRKLENLELPLSETTTETTTEDAKKTLADLPEKSKKPDPLSFDLERETIENKEANYADPNNDTLVEAAIACLCGGNGPRKGSGTWHDMANTVKPVHADWGLHDEEVGKALVIVRAAIALFLEEKRQMAVYKYPSFAANYGHYLSRAMDGDTGERSSRPRDDPDAVYERATRMTKERLRKRGKP